MQIKVNEKILSIPPHISTSWSSIVALHMKGNVLVITLKDETIINIPSLTPETIELIFNYHAAYLERAYFDSSISQQIQFTKDESLNELIEQSGSTLRLGFGAGNGMNINNAMQHNPAQANAPDLPPEILQKISAISKILSPEETILPKAEPACNCFHCQIARAINPTQTATTSSIDLEQEEEIKEEELHFQQWNIAQTGEKLFAVTNRLDDREKYSVYLGQPIGCTCGKQGCEHIVAVLKT